MDLHSGFTLFKIFTTNTYIEFTCCSVIYSTFNPMYCRLDATNQKRLHLFGSLNWDTVYTESLQCFDSSINLLKLYFNSHTLKRIQNLANFRSRTDIYRSISFETETFTQLYNLYLSCQRLQKNSCSRHKKY